MDMIFIFGIIALATMVILGFLIYDQLKTLQYRLEQQIEQNEKLMKLLSSQNKTREWEA